MNTKEKITITSIKWIEKNGFKNLSLRTIAKEAHVTTGAVYTYFKNKADLFYQLTIEISKQFVTEIQTKTTTNLNSYDQLVTIAQKICFEFQEHPNKMDFLFFNPIAQKIYQENNNQFELLNLIKKLIHEINPGRTSDNNLFIQLWSFIQGYTLLIKNQIIVFNQNLVKQTLISLIGGIK